MDLNIIAPGERVRVGVVSDADYIYATVIQVVISGCHITHQYPAVPNIQYQVVWWDGRTRREHLVEACEVAVDACSRNISVGFHI